MNSFKLKMSSGKCEVFCWGLNIFKAPVMPSSWWRKQMETFPVLLAICAGNSPVPGEFPAQRPVTRSFNVFFDLRLNKWLSKQSWGWWFETLSCPLWCHCNGEWKRRKDHSRASNYYWFNLIENVLQIILQLCHSENLLSVYMIYFT